MKKIRQPYKYTVDRITYFKCDTCGIGHTLLINSNGDGLDGKEPLWECLGCRNNKKELARAKAI